MQDRSSSQIESFRMIETEKKEERPAHWCGPAGWIILTLHGRVGRLAKTASGAVVVDSYRQKREKYDSKTFVVGSGKLEEITDG